MGRHTKQQIKPNMQEKHKVLCHECKNATSLEKKMFNMQRFDVDGICLWLLMKLDMNNC